MSGFGYTRGPYTMLDGSSANSSTYTSNAFLVADWSSLAVSIFTTAAVASNTTLQGSNDNGLTSAIAAASWSNLSVIAAPGLYKIDTGFRWLRAVKPAVDSQSSVVIHGQVK